MSHEHELLEQDRAEMHMPPTAAATPSLMSMQAYREMYERSISDPDGFWSEQANTCLSWFQTFSRVRSGSMRDGDHAWFENGQINVAYNCVDRHVYNGRAEKVALLWEGDEPGTVRKITYRQLLQEICKLANALKRIGVKKGDSVCIYMPMVPEAIVAMLACARIGAPHSVVFAGFSETSLRDRIVDANSKIVITADEGRRNGHSIPLKAIADAAIKDLATLVTAVIVYQHTGTHVAMQEGRDIYWHDVLMPERPVCPPERLDSEDPLFMLYTSGSTGKPKGIMHTQAGYLLYAHMTTKYTFGLREDDIFACVADVGWITGHTYICYGPLSNGATTFMFESTPLYPNPGRYWNTVERHRITIFYTSPTAIRAIMKYGAEPVKRYDISSIRILGTVGEPINPEAWRWLYNVVGAGKCGIQDTYWQTETGGHVITPLAGVTPMKPGSACLPFFGIEPVVLSSDGQELTGNAVSGVLAIRHSWPGMSRTIFGDHERFMMTYLRPYKNFYFTGDGVERDKDGYYWITGRVDDVMNVSGHRIGTAEIESALVAHPSVAEAAVIGIPHDVKGTSLFCFVILKQYIESSPDLPKLLTLQVREQVGAFAAPDDVLIVNSLPKTRSGKIMRRLLRKIASGELDSLGDISTLAEPDLVANLITSVQQHRTEKAKQKR